jgi:nucleoid-associated protein YgaU
MVDRKPNPTGGAPKADFSDVQSGSSTTAPSVQPARPAARTYTVVSGDNLSKIARRELGDANKWHAIFEANRDKIEDPDKIQPGQVLTIPSDS